MYKIFYLSENIASDPFGPIIFMQNHPSHQYRPSLSTHPTIYIYNDFWWKSTTLHKDSHITKLFAGNTFNWYVHDMLLLYEWLIPAITLSFDAFSHC